jgi:lipopolysaccharide export LptBFGC system permease protein LptF
MFDLKIVGTIIVDFLLGLCGVLFWFSDNFSHALGVEGFFKRLLAGIVCFVILIILTLVATRK